MRTLRNSIISLLVVASALFVAPAFGQDIKIGVLAKQGSEKCLKAWLPTAEYLSGKIGQEVRIVPLRFEAVEQMIEEKKVDFFLVNSSMYCEMVKKHGGTAIATLKNARQGNALTEFGGVIFVKADSPIKSIQDIKGKSFMCVKKNSFGGYQMQLNTLKSEGINPETDCKLFKEAGTHDKVVEMIQKGVIEVGCVRTDTIERLAAEGKCNLADFRILNQQESAFPFVYSTDLYPEWPLASCSGTDKALADKIGTALKEMPSDSEAAKAAKCMGWVGSLDYAKVINLLSNLKIGAFASN